MEVPLMKFSLFFLVYTLFKICAFSPKLLVEFPNTFGKLFMAGTPTNICTLYSGTINSWFLRNFINMYRYACLLPVCLSIQWGVFIENSINGWLVSTTMYCYKHVNARMSIESLTTWIGPYWVLCNHWNCMLL